MNELPTQVPVVVVGAGPAGLVMSLLLARKGIAHVVLEKREKVGTLPRARGINVRSVEILAQLGVAADLERTALREPWTQEFLYTETLAGAVIGRMPGLMGRGKAVAWSPCDYIVAAQDRLDPVLLDHASRQADARILPGHEVTGMRQDERGVEVDVRTRDGRTASVRAQFLVAADGGSSPVREWAGIPQVGQPNLRSFVNVHLRADLSAFTNGREATLMWTLAPGVEGVFQPLDGDRLWAVQIQFDPAQDGLERWTQERIVARLRAMIGSPQAQDTHFEILNVYAYTLSVMLAERLRQGRVLLVGDSAHKIPPYGGFGLNTGIQAAHNLAWKLAAVLRGEAPPALLDTYTAERLEVAQRNCAFGRTNAGYVEQMMGALRAAASLQERQQAFARSRQYGNWMGLDLGAHYERPGAYVPDDIAPPTVGDPVVDYVPHAKPGWRAPHLWLRQGDERVSSIELFDDAFTLLCTEAGEAWVAACAQARPAMRAWRIGADGDLQPEEAGAFERLYGVGASGAVLVRPDGHVAARWPSAPADPAKALAVALDRTLCKAG